MRQLTKFSLLLAGVAVAPLAVPTAVSAQSAAAASASSAPAPLPALVREVRIPNEVFTLDNGLTVIVHEDRKAPTCSSI